MKKYVLLLFSLIGCYGSIASQTNFSLSTIQEIGLPVLLITTVNHEEPTCDYVVHPVGSMGSSVRNATKVPCRVVLIHQADTLFDSKEYVKNTSGATIKINGNTSAFNRYKPYKIKLQQKADLLCRNNNSYSDKDWRILPSTFSIKTIIGLKVNELMGLPWTPAYLPCNVFINNDYRGCYYLIESVKRNSECRLNVDKEKGFIVERDPYWWNENSYFATDFFSNSQSYRWTWKYPDEEEVTTEQLNTIKNYLQLTEKSIKEGTYDLYIDISSFATWLLAHDLLGTWDSGGSNLFVMKYDDLSPLQMGNMWDFDSILSMAIGSYSRYHTGSIDFYFPTLLQNTNTAFATAYYTKWEEIKETLPQQVITFVSSWINSEQGKAFQISRQYYADRWKINYTTVESELKQLVDWMNQHIPLLDERIQHDYKPKLPHKPEITDTNHVFLSKRDTLIYNLQGQPTNIYKNNVYIINGKKVIVK